MVLGHLKRGCFTFALTGIRKYRRKRTHASGFRIYMSDPEPLAALFLTVNFDFKTLVDVLHVNPRNGITA